MGPTAKFDISTLLRNMPHRECLHNCIPSKSGKICLKLSSESWESIFPKRETPAPSARDTFMTLSLSCSARAQKKKLLTIFTKLLINSGFWLAVLLSKLKNLKWTLSTWWHHTLYYASSMPILYCNKIFRKDYWWNRKPGHLSIKWWFTFAFHEQMKLGVRMTMIQEGTENTGQSKPLRITGDRDKVMVWLYFFQAL